jgi:hypothetical protein
MYPSYIIGKLIFSLKIANGGRRSGDLLGFSLYLYHFKIHGWLSTLLICMMHAYLVTQDASSTYKFDVCGGKGAAGRGFHSLSYFNYKNINTCIMNTTALVDKDIRNQKLIELNYIQLYFTLMGLSNTQSNSFEHFFMNYYITMYKGTALVSIFSPPPV